MVGIVGVVVDWSVVDVVDGDIEIVEVGFFVVVVDSFSRAQVLPPTQVYPKGQHDLPHFGRLSFNLEVLTGFFGNRAGSCRLTSQVIGLIYEQS